MKSKIYLILFVFLIFLVGINGVFAENIDETTDVSALSVDDADESLSSGGLSSTVNSWSDLQADAVNNNIDTIYLNGTNFKPSCQISFNHNVNIVGLNGSYVGYPYWTNNTYGDYIPFYSGSNLNIVFENLTFQYMSGNILIKVAGHGNYVFKNCLFRNVNATGDHQAVVWLNSGEALLDNCTFVECNTSYGAVSNYNENSVNLVHMTVKDSNFVENYATVEPGCINNCGQLEVINSTFRDNYAVWWAGAIHTHYDANANIRKSKFINNVAGWNGGALYTYSTLTIIDSDFIGNNCTTNSGGGAIGCLAYWGHTAPTVTIMNSNFTDNNNTNTGGNGGAIAFSGGTLDVYNTYFGGNDAITGTAIAAGSLVNSHLVNNTFVGNGRRGNNSDGDTLVLSGDYVLSNNMYDDTPMTIVVSLDSEFSFTNNVTCNIVVDTSYTDVVDNAYYKIYFDGINTKNTTDTSFTLNVNGINHAVNVILVSNLIEYNITSKSIIIPKPAIYVSTTGKDTNDGLTILTPVKTIGKAVTLSKNNNIPTIAVASGTYPISSRISITKDVHFIGDGNVIFNANSFSGTQEFYASAQTTSTFENINLVNSGKTIFQGTLNNIKLEFINCTVKDNSLTSGNLIRTPYLFIKDSVFENNARSIYFTNGDVINSTFIDNTGVDGVLYLRGSGNTVNIINSSFINNGGTNGVIYAYQFKNIDIDGCLFVNNTATSANAIYIYSRSSSCSLVVEDCVFLNNGVASSIARSGVHAGTIVTANNNWWGNTADNYNADLTSVSSGVTVSSWLFMNLSADSNPVIVGDRKNVDITLNNLYTPEAIIYNVNNNLPKLDLDVSCINGVADSIINIVNGAGNIDYTATNEGDGVLTVSYEGISQNITLNNLGYNFTVDVCDIQLGDDEIINVILPSDATGTVNIKIGDYENNARLVNGAVSFVVSGLNGGQYDVSLTYDGNYRGFNYITSFYVDSTEITLRYASKLSFDSDITLNVFVVDDATGTVEVTVNGVSNNYTLSYGGVNVPLTNLTNSGRNNIDVYYYGDENYAPGHIDTYLMFNDNDYQWAMDGHDTKNTGKSSFNGTATANILWGIQFNESIVDSIVDEEGSIYIATVSSIYKYDSRGIFVWKFTLVGDANFSGLAISRDVIIAPRAGDTIYFIKKDDGLQYSFANIWQGSSLFEPVVDDEGNIYISGEYKNDTNNESNSYYILTVIPYSMWVNGGTPTVVNLGLHNLTSAPTVIENNKTVCIGSTDGLLIVNITNSSNNILINACGGVVCRPVVTSDGTIYYLTNNKLVKTSANGNIAFNNSVVGYSLALTDNQIIIGGTDCLHYFNLTNGNNIEEFLYCNSSSKILVDANNYIYVGDENGNIYRTLYNDSTFWLSIANPVLGSFAMDNRGFIYIWDSNNIFYALGEESFSYSPVFSYKNEELLGVSLDDILSLNTNENLVSDPGMEYTFLDASRIILNGEEFEENSYFVYSEDSVSGEDLEDFMIFNSDIDEISGNTIFIERYWENWVLGPFSSDIAEEYPTIPFDDGIDNAIVIDGKNSTLDLNNHPYFFTFIETVDSEYYEDPDFEYTRAYIIFKNFNFVNLYGMTTNGLFINNYDKFDGVIILYNCTFDNFSFGSRTPYFQPSNLKVVNCSFLNFDTPTHFSNFQTGAFCLHENLTFKDCIFQKCDNIVFGFSLAFGTEVYEPHNIKIINNTIITNYAYINPYSGWDLDGIYFEGNYFISNANSKGNERYGMDTIKRFENSDVQTVIIKNYFATMNYPWQTNVTVTANSTHLIFTLDDVDDGILTYGDEDIAISNGVGSYPVSESPGESITGSTSFLGDKYYARISDFTVTLPKTDPDFTIEANPIIYNQSVPSVTINTDNDPDFNITVWDVTNNLVYNTTSKKGNINLKGLAVGNYIINVTSIEDATYNAVSKTTILTVRQAGTEITSTEVNDNNLVINLNNSLVNGAASVNIDNISYYADVVGGVITLDISILEPKEYAATVSYLGNTNFTAFSDEKITFTISDARTAPTISTEDFTITEGQNVLINMTVAGATGDIVVIIGETKYLATLNDENKATITVPGLTHGEVKANVNYMGDKNYLPANKTITITIVEKVKLNPNLKLDIEDTVVSVSIDSEATGDVIVTVGDISFVCDAGALAPIDVSKYLGNGTYSVSVKYVGDDNFTDAAQIGGSVTVPEEEQPVQNETEVVTPEMSVKVTNTTVEVTLPDDATGNVLVDVDGQGYYAPVKEGKATVNVIGLDAGTYPVTVNYLGDDKYSNATKSASVTVPDEEQPVVELKDPGLKLDIKDTVITVSIDPKATGDVIVTVGDISFVCDAQDLAPIDVSKYLGNGTYSVSVKYVGDDNFTDAAQIGGSITIPDEEQPVQNETEPVTPEMSVKVTNTTVEVTLPKDATGNVLVDVGGQGYYAPVKDGKASVNVIGLDAGTYPVTVNYLGDDKYANATKSTSITIPDEEQPVQNETELVTPEMSVKVTNTTVEVTLPKDATGNVLVDVGGQGYYAPVKDGKASVNVIGLDAGTYPTTVTYAGDDKYANATKSASVTVPEEEQPAQNETEVVTPAMSVKVTNTTVDVTLPGDATGYVLADVNGQGYYAKVTNGKASIDIVGLDAGTYPVTVDYLGDDKYANATKTASVTIPDEDQPAQNETEPVTPQMSVKVTNTTVEVTLPGDATGNVLVDVNGQGYYAPVKDGKASVNVIGLDAGTYPATVKYAGDDKYANATGSARVTVPKDEEPAQNETEPVDSNAKVDISEDAVNVELPKDATGYVLVDVDGKGYYAPVKDGKATLELPELDEGEHTVSVTYTGDDKYKPATANKTITVEKEIATVVTEDLTKFEKGTGSFVANFTDAEGNSLANTKVTFEINGGTYTRTTNANGQATFAVNLVPGTYTIKTTNPVTKETATNTITVLPRFTEDSDLVKYFRNDSQYVLKVLDDDGNPAKAGEIVTYNINGVFYNRTTNASGHVKLNINLPPDTYIITAEYKGCKVAHTVKVLPTLTGSDITKKYGQAGAYEAKLVDGQGKAYANQKIEFNINGVMYQRTTNADGVAKLNINLQAGKYIISASYGQARISNTVTVTA